MLKLSALFLLLLAAVHSVSAHVYLLKLNVDGKYTERGEYIRPYRESIVNSPVTDLESEDLRCRTAKMDAKATKNLTLTAGVKFGILFRENAKEQSRFIEEAHKGPVMIYLAPLASNGEGDVWFKIFEKGYDTKAKKFYTEVLQDTRGAMDFTIPEDIPAGEYLMRTEVVALHQAKKKEGAEFYPNCVQIKLVSKGTAKPKGYPIPGVYKADHPGLLVDIYDPIKSYEIPGPPLYSKELGTTPQNQEGEIPEEGGEPENGEPVVKKPKPPAGKKKPCNGRKKKRHFK